MNKNAFLSFILITVLCGFQAKETFSQTTGASINTTGAPADPSAILDVSSHTQGVLITRMTTAERNAISSPAEGLMIFNTDTKCFEFYAYNMWQTGTCAICPIPLAPVTSINVAQQTQIEWNWNTVTNATGYKWNTVNDFSTATDMLTNTSKTETGLTCGTSYTRYIWAYNVCGNSTVTTLSQSTSACPFSCGTSTVTFTYNGGSVTYGTVSHNGQCWLDRNLGASQVATAYNDAAAYGDLFQWGRLADGHQLRNSTVTTTQSGSDVPGNNNYINPPSWPFDWRLTQNDALWQGLNGTNNPCPSGWRIPTIAELTTEKASWSSQNYYGAFASPLKLTAAGLRGWDGTLHFEGDYGNYWSFDQITPNVTYVQFYDSGVSVRTDAVRAFGHSVRCIKD